MKNNRLPQIPPLPAVLLAIISVQAGAAIAKGLFPAIGPESTASLRIGLSAVILLIANRPNLLKLTKVQWKAVALYGLVLGAMNLIFYMAIKRIPLALGVTLEFIGPLVLAVMNSKKAMDYLWVLLAATGIALIAPWSETGLDLTGVLLALLAGGLWAAYIVLGGKISKVMKGGDGVSVGMIFATLLVVPFGIGSGGFGNLTPGLLLMAAALALLSSAIPFTLEMSALSKMPARTFSILMSLEPAVAALCGIVFLNEHLSLLEYCSVALVIIASAGATITSKRKAL